MSEELDLRIQGIDAIKETMDKYSSSSADFFIIANDEEVARARFAHGDDKDLDIYVVHKVKLAGKDRYIACLSPAGIACPFCQAGHKPAVRMFLTVLDTRDQKMKIWDRGKTEVPNILGLITRYGRLDSRYYDVQRHGKKGDKETKYQFFPLDPIPNADVLKREPILAENGFVMRKSADEMKRLLTEVAPADNKFGSQPQTGAPGGAVGKMF